MTSVLKTAVNVNLDDVTPPVR